MRHHTGQIAIEFLLLIGLSIVIIVALLAAVYSISEYDSKTRTVKELDDLGASIQQELLLASSVEDGYSRRINIPETINNHHYNITLSTYNNHTFIILQYELAELYYQVPFVSGNITKGDNIITRNKELYITH
jgi:hypothetical protein